MAPKVQLAFITDEAKRKATYKKRMKGFRKKMNEISVLCDVDVCAIVASEFQQEPEFLPSKLDAEYVVEKFKTMPEMEQTRKMHDHVSYIKERIAKANEQLKKQMKENHDKRMTEVMYECLAGNVDFDRFELQELKDLDKVANQNMKVIVERIEVLKGAGPSQVQGTATNAGEAMSGQPLQPYGGTSNAAGTMAGERVQLFGSTNAAQVMAGEPTQPYGGTNAARPITAEEQMQLFSPANATGNMAGVPTQPYGGTNAARPITTEEQMQLFGPANATGNMAGVPTHPYGWTSFSDFLAADSDSSGNAGGFFPAEPNTANTAGGMPRGSMLPFGWSGATGDEGASSSNAAGGSGAGGSSQN